MVARLIKTLAACCLLLALGGLMIFDSVLVALVPAIVQISFHTIEANIVTPLILGRRLTLNPVLILLSLTASVAPSKSSGR